MSISALNKAGGELRRYSSYRPPKTSFVFNNKGRAVADPASDLRADAIAAA